MQINPLIQIKELKSEYIYNSKMAEHWLKANDAEMYKKYSDRCREIHKESNRILRSIYTPIHSKETLIIA